MVRDPKPTRGYSYSDVLRTQNPTRILGRMERYDPSEGHADERLDYVREAALYALRIRHPSEQDDGERRNP